MRQFTKAYRHTGRSSLQALTLLLISLLAASALWACAAGDGDDDESGGTNPDTGASSFTLAASVDSRGQALVSFSLPSDTTKFSVTAEVPSANGVRFTDLSDEDGTDYLGGSREEISLSTSELPYLNSANAPSRDVDPTVDASKRFTATAVASGVRDGQTMTFSINAKSDTNFASGRMHVNVFYVGDVGQDATTKGAIQTAIQGFRNIFSQSANITLDVSEIDVDGPIVLPLPIDGNSFYLSATRGAFSPAVNIFVGGDLEGSSGDLLGIAGGIPGPANPSPRSGVSISITTGAGPDGRYSDEDLRILGETLAHESGHFMGLFHPVDFSGDVVVDSDPLDDTPSCTVFLDCVSNANLAGNLMFATPVASGSGTFVEQNNLSSQQRGVLNRYIVVD